MTESMTEDCIDGRIETLPPEKIQWPKGKPETG